MKQDDIISISSDEDVPLNYLGSLQSGPSATDLKIHCIQQCEFCEAVFFNRYTALIHNAKHIIVPLLKHNVYQCMECLYYFTSQIELEHHKETKHGKELSNSNNESDINNKMEKLHMAISDIVKMELDVKLEDYLVKNKINLPVKVKEELHVKEELKIENYVNNTVDEDLKNHVSEAKLKISNRLQFEDDSDENDEAVLENNVCNMGGNGLLNDLTTVCKVNLNLFDKPWVGEEKDVKLETSLNNVNGEVVEATKVENMEASVVEFTPSTHYEDLIRPGMYRCKRCSGTFPTRFQLIRHEMSHVKLRNALPLLCIYCERFISNTRVVFKKHVDEHHWTECSPRPTQLPTCKTCGLRYYSYTKHAKNYHVGISRRARPSDGRPFCQRCNQAFSSEEEKVSHINTKHLVEKKCHQCGMISTAIEIQEHQKTCMQPGVLDNFDAGDTLCYSAMLKLCDVCCLFLKSKNNMQYTTVRSISEVGNRLDCERCGKKYFELKLVRRTTIQKRKEKYAERKKHLSNRTRLKNIQQRLKMINKLSRY